MHLIHRGILNKSYKENNLKSFKASFKKGYGVETDIHATKDNKFICFHDFSLKKTFKINKSIKNLNQVVYILMVMLQIQEPLLVDLDNQEMDVKVGFGVWKNT